MDLTRRSFLGIAGTAGLIAGAGLAGCAPTSANTGGSQQDAPQDLSLIHI